MAIYSNLAQLGREKLPNNTVYALVDVDGRLMLAPEWSGLEEYYIGDYVRHDGTPYGCNLYRAKVNIPAPVDPEVPNVWDSTLWDAVTVEGELKRLEGIMSGGIHYRGKTTTALYDGATTNPIIISDNSYTAESGDLVIVDLVNVASTYATATAYSVHQYIKNGGIYYIVNTAISSSENTSFTAIESKVSVVTSDPEFLFDGTTWAALGSISEGLGDLAFKDTASGTYVKPTGQGSVTINTYSPSKKKLSTDTIVGTNGTVNASEVSVKTTKSFAIRNQTATTVAVADAEATTVGNADVGTAVSVGTSLTGTTTFNTNAIKSAVLDGTTTFNTDAIKSATLGGTTSFAPQAVIPSVSGDCLVLTNVTLEQVTISTEAASTGTVSIITTAADTGTVGLGKSSITPATAASTLSIRGVSGTTDIYGTSGTDTAITELNITAVTPAKVGSQKTFATGQLESGNQIVVDITPGTTTANVDVGTTTDTVTVK